MKRRLLVVWDYESEESGFILVDVSQPLAKGLRYGEVAEAKRVIELEEAKQP